MSAIKQFYSDCAEAGFIPLDTDSFKRLEDLEDQLDLDWIEYMEHSYLGFDGNEHQADGISIASGYRLYSMGVNIDEISNFLEMFYEFSNCCDDCNSVGRFAVNKHGESFCLECY